MIKIINSPPKIYKSKTQLFIQKFINKINLMFM